MKILSLWFAFIASIAGLAYSSIHILPALDIGNTVSQNDIAIVPVPSIDVSTSSQDIISGIPIRLRIPKINVSATIESLGLTAQGAMAVTVGPVDVAWYDLGPRPGESGSAVIAGHDGWKDGIAAVFDKLSALAVGDKIYVDDRQGSTTVFVVRDIETYGKSQNDSLVFNSNDGESHLNLITCEGTWNASEQSYSNRLVVFADEDK